MIIKNKMQGSYIHWNKESDIMYISSSKTQKKKVLCLGLPRSV